MAGFLQEFNAPDILLGVIAKSRNPRLTVSLYIENVSVPDHFKLCWCFFVSSDGFCHAKIEGNFVVNILCQCRFCSHFSCSFLCFWYFYVFGRLDKDIV